MNPTEFRRHLHAHPELSFKEHDTAAFIADRLTELGIEHRPIARTGVLAWIEGRGKADPKRRAVVLRADIDALPITEQNDIGWRSCTPGVMHACGHDMHAAVLFGVLQQLAAEPDFRGTPFGLFQPGEAPSQAPDWAVDALCKAGTLAIIGVYPQTAHSFPIGTAMNKNLTINMGNCNHRKYIPHLVTLVRSGAVDPLDILTKVEPMTDAISAYKTFDQTRPGWMKVELVPGL